jgi:hypothetical protein
MTDDKISESENTNNIVRKRIYPTLPTAPPNEYTYLNRIKTTDPQNYRLHIINDIQIELEKNIEERKKWKKRYNKGLFAINFTDTTLTILSTLMGVAEIGLLTALHLPDIVLGMQISTLSFGVGSLITKYISRRLRFKSDKHQNIITLAEAKLNTIQDHVSKAIEDGTISEEEFSHILEERTKFRALKEQFITDSSKQIFDLEKTMEKEIEKGRLLGVTEIKEKINEVLK